MVETTESGFEKTPPPSRKQIGQSAWTLFHTMAATYPIKASEQQQKDMKGYIKAFTKTFPCPPCMADFRVWMATPGNEPQLQGREEFGDWLCRAHNDVNKKLGKNTFDCKEWKARWRDGWNASK